MKSIFALATVLLAGAVSAQNGTVVVTETLTDYTTICPAATVITAGGSTYTATGPTTIVITGPVTVTRPVYTTSTVLCVDCAPTTSAAAIVSASPVSTAPAGTAPYINGTSIVPGSPISTGSTPSGSAISSSIPIPTGAAERVLAGSGAGLAAALGMAAYLL